MTSERSPIQDLRSKLVDAGSKLLRDEMHAFIELCAHSDLEWNDLLNGLNLPQFLSEDAALRLHQKLQIPIKDRTVKLDRPFGERSKRQRHQPH